MNKGIIRDAFLLFIITLIAGFCLGAVHEITLEPIAQAQLASATATYQEVYPEAASFETTDELTAAVAAAPEALAGQDFLHHASVLVILIGDFILCVCHAGELVGLIVAHFQGGFYTICAGQHLFGHAPGLVVGVAEGDLACAAGRLLKQSANAGIAV